MKSNFWLAELLVTLIFLILTTSPVFGQTPTVIIEDTVIVSGDTSRVDILKYQPQEKTTYIFRNNSITAQNSNEHIVLFGSENESSNDRNLDNTQITGNKLTWNGSDPTLTNSTEAILFGYSINALIKYNFVRNCPYGTPVKSYGMTYTAGGVAYNVYSGSFKVGTGSKGTSGIDFFNNTFLNTRNKGQNVIGSVYITANYDTKAPNPPPSVNCRIENNIFYTRHQVANIYIDSASLNGLVCDYNLYYCEDGEPVFMVAGKTIGLSEWQAMGYDTHSTVANPHFTDSVSLIPAAALNSGINLGQEWKDGLNIHTVFGHSPVLQSQGSTWQVGAYILDSASGSKPPEDENEFVLVYPNPVNNILFLIFKDKENTNNIQLYNSKASMVLETVIRGDSSLDFSGFSSGFYLLCISGGRQKKILKIIKE